MPDGIVYDIAKAIHASKDDMVKNHPVFRNFDPDRMTEEIGVPWHPAAIKFYQEAQPVAAQGLSRGGCRAALHVLANAVQGCTTEFGGLGSRCPLP
jgi:hypothetical protein